MTRRETYDIFAIVSIAIGINENTASVHLPILPHPVVNRTVRIVIHSAAMHFPIQPISIVLLFDVTTSSSFICRSGVNHHSFSMTLIVPPLSFISVAIANKWEKLSLDKDYQNASRKAFLHVCVYAYTMSLGFFPLTAVYISIRQPQCPFSVNSSVTPFTFISANENGT